MESSAANLVEHWDWAAKKGLMNLNTARSLRAACAQVLAVLDNWESIDIRDLNVDDTLARFVNLRKKDFKPQSLETYKQRFRYAVTQYLAYLENPAGWRPRFRERTAAERKPSREAVMPQASTDTPSDRGGTIITYPFPLREGLIVRLSLPPDLTLAEVQRLTSYMTILAVDAGRPQK